MDIFDRVKMLAKRDNISIGGLEKKLGFSNKSLYPHTKGSTIRGDRVVALARYFGVSTDWLLTGEDIYNNEEIDLISLYRSLNAEGKENVMNYIRFTSEQAIYKKSDKAEVV